MNDAALRPRLIVVAGPNGSGKTSIAEQLLRHAWMGGCEYVNPDNMARDLISLPAPHKDQAFLKKRG